MNHHRKALEDIYITWSYNFGKKNKLYFIVLIMQKGLLFIICMYV